MCALRLPATASVLASAALKKMASPSRPSSNMAEFRNALKKAKHIVALTGAGTSAESGVPTFRGAGGWWRTYRSEDLASPGAFRERPALVWEFYQYRRQLVATKEPNQAHLALAELQRRWEAAGRRFRLVTQNVDGLHQRAGSERVLELHGGLFRTRCTACGDIRENRDDPVCPALAGAGSPAKDSPAALVAEKDLPRCSLPSCGGLLRPDIIWFGENLDEGVLEQAHTELELCDLCLVVGTSSVVYPAAMFAPMVAQRGVPVAEFNLEMTPASSSFGFHFSGPCGPMLSEALAP